MITLAIETSCDETSVAVLKENRVISNIIYSQIKEHSKFGGVVPEIASRKHIEKIIPVFKEAINVANIEIKDIDIISVTQGPGLVGSLLVGINFSKGIAYALKKPLYTVHHIEGHILAVLIENEIKFPFLSLVASGGHTNLFLVKNYGDYTLLGRTLDDAAGEAFDKVAKMLKLGYPGGPIIEKLARKGEAIIDFPIAFKEKGNLNFSFSGLKTSVMNYIRKNKDNFKIEDLAASFQNTIAETFILKIKEAVKMYKVNAITFSGGVACNGYLRNKLKKFSEKIGKDFFSPSPIYCSDNAAMIGFTAYYKHIREPEKFPFDFKINALPRMKLCS